MEFMLVIVPIISGLIFLLAFGLILSVIIRGIKQEHKNNNSPKLTVDAKVVSKRTNYRRNTTSNSHMGHTTYYVTFEVQSGDRMELNMPGQEYGLLVEGDYGELSFQGTRYLGFQRKVQTYDL